MSIDEAIERCETLATNGQNIFPRDPDIAEDCNEKYKQLAEWLEELKDYRDKNKMVVRVDAENMDSIKDKIEELSRYAENQYNKAIDDFVKAIVDRGLSSNDDKYCITRYDNYLKVIKEIAEQLKEGGNNELSEHSKSKGNRTGK